MTPIPSLSLALLAPTGKLRAAINFGNPVLAAKDAATGQPRGVSVDLALELGRRLGVPVELVSYDAAGKVVEALKSSAWDVAFLAIDPARAAEITYTPPYVVIEGAYLVPRDSLIRSNEDVDRPGVRIAVATGSAYDLYLSRVIKQATLVRTPNSLEVTDMFVAQKLEVRAGVKQQLEADARRVPGLRLARGPVHGDQSGDGRAPWSRSGGRISARLHRTDESVRLRRGLACPQPRRGGRHRASGRRSLRAAAPNSFGGFRPSADPSENAPRGS